MEKFIVHDHSNDGINRRGMLRCMAWAGAGLVWSVAGGVPKSFALPHPDHQGIARGTDFSFVQISDSHMGFSKEANPDVAGTLQTAVDRINALPDAPELLIHTGDISHLSKPSEFDTVEKILQGAKTKQTFYVPGEHDVLTDNGRQFLERFGKGAKGQGWYSFDMKGIHFIGLVNVLDLKPGGLGNLGTEQLEWLEKDVAVLSSSTPIVVFAHVPLWIVYQEWGWGTADGAAALSYLKRFGSVTVLNGHIHQTMQKVEGNITFHTAASTAFPQPAPGSEPSPGPMKVPPGQLQQVLGITNVHYMQGRTSLAIVDSPLASDKTQSREPAVGIDNFSFAPGSVTVAAGSKVTWTNHDDIPHNVVSTEKKFASPILDTGESFLHAFDSPGSYPYYCSIHPRMTGTVLVR